MDNTQSYEEWLHSMLENDSKPHYVVYTGKGRGVYKTREEAEQASINCTTPIEEAHSASWAEVLLYRYMNRRKRRPKNGTVHERRLRAEDTK